MNKKLAKLGAASLLAVGAGSVLMKKNRMKSADPEAKAQREKELKEFRNTERGKQAKNSKGIYYSNGTRHLPARKSRRAWMTNQPTSWEAAWLPWQQPAF